MESHVSLTERAHTHTCVECMGIGMCVKGHQPRGHGILFLLCVQTHGELDCWGGLSLLYKRLHRDTTEGVSSDVWTLRCRPPV